MRRPTLSLDRGCLKLIAFVTMIADHAAILLLDGSLPLRILGRLSFPIFAYMIAEGCRHTSDRKRYFLRIFLLGALCNLVYFLAMGQLTLTILLTFSLSVLMIYALDACVEGRAKGTAHMLPPLLALLALLCLTYLLGGVTSPLRAYGVSLDYGILGALTPLLLYCLPKRWEKLCMLGALLLAETLATEWYQIFSLLALPLLWLYNGEAGNRHLKYFFYLGYPLHLLLLAFLSFWKQGLLF